jgi:amino acid transporter
VSEEKPPQSGFLAAMTAVFWSFFGVRKSADHERSAPQLKPQHYIAAGLLGALIFVLLVFSLVKVVLHFAVPGG